jgi:hypothetical protein
MPTYITDAHQSSLDDTWQGDDIPSEKDTHSTRIMFHNVNGLAAKGVTGMDTFAHEQVLLQVDLQGFSEHCLDTTKFRITNTIHEILQRYYPGQHSLQLQSSDEGAVNVYKPGGTGILAIGNIVGRQEPNGKGGDSLGRWSYMHFRRKEAPPLTVITAYQVCSRPTNILGNTAYHQQVRALSMQGRHTVSPRQAFIQDLIQFITGLQEKGHEIILGGDFNETLDDKNSGILKLITSTNLTDPFLYRFPHHQDFGTHVMGRKRIDLVFVTPALIPCITKIGYPPFQYGTNSDHRPIMIEFHTEMLFGQVYALPNNMATRCVKAKDKKSVTQFISKWYEEVDKRQGFSFQTQLDDDSAPPNIVEIVDEILGISGDIAEQSCQRRRPEFFSNQIVQQRLRVSILRGHLNALRLGKDRSKQLSRRMERLGLAFPLPPTQTTTLEALKQAHEELRQTCKNSAEVRQAELEEKIENALQNSRKTRAQILKAIKTAETNQKTYKILKAMKRRTQSSSSLDRVEIPSSWPSWEESIVSIESLEDPKTCTQWRSVTQPQEIEYYLMLRNRMHFGQAQGTPFTCSPLQRDFDWLASTPEAEQLLRGQYRSDTDIPNCMDLLQACTALTSLDATPAEITLEEFQGKINSWRESTTTSPSGRHLGRYKALFAQGYLDSGTFQGAVPFEAKQYALASLIMSVLNYCIRKTYVLERWKKIINVMIFKEPNNYKIHRLRVIHIYEADFNLILAVKWRQLLRHADAKHLLNEGQYGGRPGCEAQSLTLLEELKYDLSYLTRRTLVNFDNDASSCYDRIIVSLASIINRKYGMHRKTVAIHASTLQDAQFHLKTAAGISTTHYSPSPRFPIHGTGQGSGNSPSIWLFISSTLFDIHKGLAHGAQFVSPDGQHHVHFSMVGFVDDSTGTCNDFRPQNEGSIHEILRKMEDDAQLWSNLLYCTGGKLELPKCSFHVLRFQFRPSGAPQPEIESYENCIHLHDLETDERVRIQSKRSFEVHKTLGHFKSPYSKQKMELESLKKKADRIAVLLSISPISRKGAFLAYNSVYLPSVQYVLPQSFFSRKTLDTAQAQSMSRILSKCGYNRHTARALTYAPHDFAGGGFIPWYSLQGEGQIKHFIKHWRTNTLISRTLRMTTMWAQWQTGHNVSILEDTGTSLPYLECRWLRSLREFLQQINATIQVDMALVAQPERQKDIYIMTYARQSGLFSCSDLAVINYCRLYLHVTTVSELFDADGTTMIPKLFECHREPWFNPDTVTTLQARPSAYQIRMKWQKLCRQWVKSDGTIAASIELGKWRVPGHHLRRRRQTYIVRTMPNRVYHWRQGSYWEYQRDAFVHQQFNPVTPSQWNPQCDCTPISVDENLTGTLFIASIDHSILKPSNFRPHLTTSFTQYINALASWEQHLLQGVQMKRQPYDLVHQLTQATPTSPVLLVSDGSQRDKFLSFGWVLGSTQHEIFAEHSGVGMGEPSSHRAEAWGMLSGVVFLYHLYKYTGFHQHNQSPSSIPVKLLSDNNGLVTRVNQRTQYKIPYPNSTLAPDWDLIEQIVQTMRQLSPAILEVAWVKGHQDGHNDDLSTEAIYNIRADELAGQVTPSHQLPTIEVLPAERCRLAINQETINGHYTKHIRQAYTLPAYHHYLVHRYGWTMNQIHHIDWTVFQRASHNSAIDHVQLLKLVHLKLPTNSEMAKANPHHSDKCQYCTERQTFHHLLKCTNTMSAAFRDQIQEVIEVYLDLQEVPIPLAHGLLYVLRRILGLPQIHTLSKFDQSIATCVQEQLQLGDQFLQGFLISSWRTTLERINDKYCIDRRRNATDVIAGLVKKLWQEQLTLWDKHTSTIAFSTTRPPTRIYDKLEMYKSKVRQLHSLRDQCLPSHREQYFHDDIDTFLFTASCAQLKQYLHHYEAAIQASVTSAKKHPIRSIFTFPGYTRWRTRLTGNPLRNALPAPPPVAQGTPAIAHASDENGGNYLYRKHTRWKPVTNPLRTITSYFHQKQA